jgi:hypothetical protein
VLPLSTIFYSLTIFVKGNVAAVSGSFPSCGNPAKPQQLAPEAGASGNDPQDVVEPA